jgi:hypothetical protein
VKRKDGENPLQTSHCCIWSLKLTDKKVWILNQSLELIFREGFSFRLIHESESLPVFVETNGLTAGFA